MTRNLPSRPSKPPTSQTHQNDNVTMSNQPGRSTPTANVEIPDMPTEITTLTEDLRDIEAYYPVSFSPARITRIRAYLQDKTNWLATVPFETLDRSGQVDFLLLQSYLKRRLHATQLDPSISPLLDPWSGDLLELLAQRQAAAPVDGEVAAQKLARATATVESLTKEISSGKTFDLQRPTALKISNALNELQSHFVDWFAFYNGYDPLLTWWLRAPHTALQTALTNFATTVHSHLIGTALVGQPCGRETLLADLEAERIPYSPEELLEIGEREYAWCETEMLAAAREMGCGDDWRAALERVKDLYVPPGQQPQLVRELSAEAIAWVKEREMVTIPRIAEETIRTEMMSPEAQKANPFFLGGPLIQVSYPTEEMGQEAKMMSMRGNSRPLSRSTVFHELVPGHHLQWYYMARWKRYRTAFMTPFWTEGWAFYWEMVLYAQGFAGRAEERVGMLFWRMHRCVRIVFSIRFHLGEISPQECVETLVDRVGHERATAEGEVRRSFNGDYSPLYQAGYMLGALQFRKLREEVVEGGEMGEKEFHDAILRENQMPVELVRAVVKGEELEREGTARWRFYELE